MLKEFVNAQGMIPCVEARDGKAVKGGKTMQFAPVDAREAVSSGAWLVDVPDTRTAPASSAPASSEPASSEPAPQKKDAPK